MECKTTVVGRLRAYAKMGKGSVLAEEDLGTRSGVYVRCETKSEGRLRQSHQAGISLVGSRSRLVHGNPHLGYADLAALLLSKSFTTGTIPVFVQILTFSPPAFPSSP